VKCEKAQKPLGNSAGRSISAFVITWAAGAGAGACANCTVTCTVAHNEQLAWVAASSAWKCAACTVPKSTTSSTHKAARNTLSESAAPAFWAEPPIFRHYTAARTIGAHNPVILSEVERDGSCRVNHPFAVSCERKGCLPRSSSCCNAANEPIAPLRPPAASAQCFVRPPDAPYPPPRQHPDRSATRRPSQRSCDRSATQRSPAALR
jgi:hypothetical protein